MAAKGPTATSLYVYKAKLVRVVDGDTVILDISLGLDLWLFKQICRLYGIDAPERHTDTRIAGDKSKERLTVMLADCTELFVRTYYDRTDSFQRILVDVWADGLYINQQLVKEGFAVAKVDWC